jgi:hypothetical protein
MGKQDRGGSGRGKQAQVCLRYFIEFYQQQKICFQQRVHYEMNIHSHGQTNHFFCTFLGENGKKCIICNLFTRLCDLRRTLMLYSEALVFFLILDLNKIIVSLTMRFFNEILM